MAESVVPLERMRRDDEAVYARVVGQCDLDGHRCTAGPTPLVEHVSDRLSGEGAAAMGVGEGYVELGRAILVEQAKQAAGGATQVAAVFGNFSRNDWAAGQPANNRLRPRCSRLLRLSTSNAARWASSSTC